MEIERKSIRVGIAAILFALILRLGTTGVFGAVMDAITTPEALSMMLYLETGHLIRPIRPEDNSQPENTTIPTETTNPTETESLLPDLPVFAQTDAQLVEVHNVCDYDTDLPALLQQPLKWDLKQDKPTVLILHTHATESYQPTGEYKETTDYRTLDTDYNLVSVGAELKRLLEEGGIHVIHDTALHDYPSYSGSYSEARTYIKDYLKKEPSIQLVLDLHRDAVENKKGQQVAFTVNHKGEKTAQLMMVVGTDANGLNHPNWPENMALAVKMHALLEKTCPGICRPISFRKQRFNQDLSPGGMLIEVGSAGNTREEALRGVKVLAEVILALAEGTGSQ